MRRLSAAAFLLLLAPALLAAVERKVSPGAAGPNRLDVDVPLLSHAAVDLRDLRLLDDAQREVGFLLVDPVATEPAWIDGRMLPIAASKKSSGFEADLGRPTEIDRLRLDGIAAPFLKRARVEGSGDRGHWTLLSDATVFDLPDDRLRLLDIPFEPGTYRYLRVTWDDSSSARINRIGSVTARVHGSATPPEPIRAAVPFRKHASEPGKSRYRIVLPGPHLPIQAIELRVANGNVFRDATITEPRFGNGEVLPVMLGSGRVRRAERWGAVAEAMAVPIERPTGRELDLVVDDGNNAPLALTAVIARFTPQPWIYFEAADTTQLTARYGNPRLNAPHYDLEASRRFLEKAKPTLATWTKTAAPAPAAVPESDTAAALQGATVDRGAFRVERPVSSAPAGLAVLLLDADVLARSRDLADVRVVSASDRQIPYVIEKRDEPLVLPLALEPADGPRDTTVYRIKLPFATMPDGTRLVFRTSARVFERTVDLRRPADDRHGRLPEPIASAAWRADDPDLLPPAITFDAPLSGSDVLEVLVHEGDNAPLPITGAELLLPSVALRFHNPGTPLSLLYGNDELGAPRYDLALLAPRLFAQPARELTLRPVAAAGEDHMGLGARRFFWIAIAVAAMVLLALLGRILTPLVRPNSA
jgi:Protein of unknown function (DUF3999)